MTFEKMISTAPNSPGVYKMYDADRKLLYVGKAKDLKKRLNQYKDGEKLEYHKIVMRRQVAKVQWIETKTEAEALILEQGLIKTERPKYNVILKDGKMYPFLALSNDKFPRLFKFRSLVTPKKDVFGPFPFIQDMHETIKLIQKICQVRTCANSVMNAHKRRPCLFFQTGLCSAPCQNGDKYGERVRLARRILNGHIRPVVSDLTKKMKEAASARDFEQAAILREKIAALQSTCAPVRITAKM